MARGYRQVDQAQRRGWAVAAGALDSVPVIFDSLYVYAWFIGFFLAGGLYWAMMARRPS